MKKSEQRQNDILAFMKKTIATKGYSPTVREGPRQKRPCKAENSASCGE